MNLKIFFNKVNILILIILFSVVAYLLEPRFLSLENLTKISLQMVPLGLLALGQTFVLISGGIDLSIGYGLSLSAIVIGAVFGMTKNIFISMAAGILAVLIISLVVIFFINKIKLSPMITTLALMISMGGLVMIITSKALYFGNVVFLKSSFLDFIGREEFLGIPVSFLLLVLFYIAAYIIFNHHKIGNYIKAIGDDENTASVMGINVGRYKALVYLFSGFCSALAGIVMSSRMSLVQPIMTGAGTLLVNSVVAVVLGGGAIKFKAGTGTVQGTFMGVLFVSLIENALIIINVAPNFKDAFRGGIIIVLLIFNRTINRD